MTKFQIVCRANLEPVTLDLPCNCVSSGFCGTDARPCDVAVLKDES